MIVQEMKEVVVNIWKEESKMPRAPDKFLVLYAEYHHMDGEKGTTFPGPRHFGRTVTAAC